MIERALKGDKIDEESVEMRPESIPSAILDENVVLKSVRKYFTIDAWQAVLHVTKAKTENHLWLCGICQNEIDDEKGNSVACENCLRWFHLSCAGLTHEPKSKHWFCGVCKSGKWTW